MALRFLRAHAAQYDIDPARVCAWGTSSGGNTALLLGLTGDDPAFETEVWAGQSTRVQAVVDCFGPADLERMVRERLSQASASDHSLFHALGGSDSAETCIERLRAVSPAAYVRPGLELPPFLLLHGDADPIVYYSDSEAMYERLRTCGYDAQLVRVTNAPHEGTFWSLPLLEHIFAFIQARIG